MLPTLMSHLRMEPVEPEDQALSEEPGEPPMQAAQEAPEQPTQAAAVPAGAEEVRMYLQDSVAALVDMSSSF